MNLDGVVLMDGDGQTDHFFMKGPGASPSSVATPGEPNSAGALFAERYKIESCLGAGAVGIVYRANDLVLQRTVALKILPANSESDTIMAFQREARAISALSHEHIVKVIDFGVGKDGAPYMVMECIEGVSLAGLLEQVEKLSVPKAAAILIQICDALQHAHDNGIVHRDLKPSNVLLTAASGYTMVKVVDFGLARVQRPGQQHKTITPAGMAAGTPLYMSPEQCRCEPADARSDLYSLGCLGFQTLSGQTPFTGSTVLAIVFKQTNEPAPALNDVPAGLRKIMLKLLAKDPAARFQSASEVMAALKPFAPKAETLKMERKKLIAMKASIFGFGFLALTLVSAVVIISLAIYCCELEIAAGDRAYKDRHFPEGEAHFKKAVALALWPGQKPEALFLLGALKHDEGSYSDAIQYFDQLLMEKTHNITPPEVRDYLFKAAVITSRMERPAKAIAYMESALSAADLSDTDRELGLAILAESYNQMKQFDKAERSATSGLALIGREGSSGPIYFRTVHALALADKEQGRFVGAADCFALLKPFEKTMGAAQLKAFLLQYLEVLQGLNDKAKAHEVQKRIEQLQQAQTPAQ